MTRIFKIVVTAANFIDINEYFSSHKSKIRIISLLLLLGIGIIIGSCMVQAEEIVYSSIIPKNKEGLLPYEVVEKTTITVPEIRVESISNSWGPISPDVTSIVTQIVVNGPELSSLSLSVFCDIYFNNIKMAEGLGEDLIVEKIDSGSLVRFTTKINNNNENIAKWWLSHIQNGEKTKVIIQGELIIDLGKVNIAYPFSWQNEFQTNMLEGINTEELSNFSFGPFRLQIKSLRFGWVKIATDEVEIRYTIKIHNPGIIPLAPIINRVEYDLSLNRIKMIEGSSGVPSIIWPGGTEAVILTTKLDSRKLQTWWFSHIKSDERTSYLFRYCLLIKFLKTTLARWPKETEGTFETDFLDRKVSHSPQ